MDLKQLRRDILYRGRVFDLIVDQVQYPSGNTSVREIAHHPGGAVTVPILDDGRVILVRQLRYPLGRFILELPAGKLSPGEDPALAAARELEEETGWKAARMDKLTSIYTTPGFCDEILHLYLARGLTPSAGGHRREEGEFSMTVEMMAMERALAMVSAGEIQDGKTIVGLMLAAQRLGTVR
jgi:ADP-ribose pyrophosphatase